MTSFTRIGLTVASTQGDPAHSVGFDILKREWPDIRSALTICDPNNTLKFREEEQPRDTALGDQYTWVWVAMTPQTPLSVLLYLADLSEGHAPVIRLRPNEYP